MPLLLEHLRDAGALRDDIALADAADTVWAINSTEIYLMFRDQRGSTEKRYQAWLTETLRRLLIKPAAPRTEHRAGN